MVIRKVFETRHKHQQTITLGKSSIEFHDYKHGLVKTLVKNDIETYDNHESIPKSGKTLKVPNETMIYHYYRGHFQSRTQEELEESLKQFNKMDYSMLKFYQKKIGGTFNPKS